MAPWAFESAEREQASVARVCSAVARDARLERDMNSIIYIVGLVVVVGAVLAFLGFR